MNTKAFLDLAPDGRRRITKEQKDFLRRGVTHLLELANVSNEGLAAVLKTLDLNWPTDRSCYTCDFFRKDLFCMYWKKKMPDDFPEKGCDKHQALDVPF
jgi:hypothetical protein